ncbi:MAG: hypothetical protein ABWZ26_06885 [Candidatus Nanopelagicales bacterium]
MSRAYVADPAARAVLAAAMFGAVSMWVAASIGPADRRPLDRVRSPAGARGGPRVPPRWWASPPALSLLTVVVAVAVVVVASESPALLAPVAVLAVAARSAGRRRRAAQAERGRLDACSALLDGLTAELRSGRLPRDALARAVDWAGFGVVGLEGSSAGSRLAHANVGDELLRPIGTAATVGGDVSALLRRQALLPGAAVLGWLAACWTVSEQRGSGLADAAARIAWTAHIDREHQAEVRSELSAARATARLLAVLPLVGIGLGHAMGANVIGVLLGGPLGAALVTASVALLVSGVAWVDRLAAGAIGGR